MAWHSYGLGTASRKALLDQDLGHLTEDVPIASISKYVGENVIDDVTALDVRPRLVDLLVVRLLLDTFINSFVFHGGGDGSLVTSGMAVTSGMGGYERMMRG